jgi:hypothetical protein
LIDFGSTRKTGEPNILGYSSSTPSISKSNTYNKSNSLFSKDIDNLLYSFKTMSFSETPEFIQRVKRLILNRGNVAGKTSDDLLAEFFFSLCKNLIRLRDIPGQKSRLVQQALALKNQDKLKRLKEINDQIKGLENEEEELNEPFHTVTLPQSTYSQMFNANNTRLPEPVFMPRPPLNNGNSPPTVGERPPGSYGGRKKRKTRKRRTRRV